MEKLKFRSDARWDFGGWINDHPNIVVRGREIGRENSSAGYTYALIACTECGKERWVDLRKLLSGKMRTGLCRNCWRANTKKGFQSGVRNYNWRGGRHLCPKDGYVYVLVTRDSPFFPMARKSRGNGGGYVSEHRLIMGKHLGRCLESWEIVHHKNGVRQDNKFENLELLGGATSHHSYNLLQRELYRLRRENKKLRDKLAKHE